MERIMECLCRGKDRKTSCAGCVQLSKFCPADSDCQVHQISYTGDKYPNNKIAKCSNYCGGAR